MVWTIEPGRSHLSTSQWSSEFARISGSFANAFRPSLILKAKKISPIKIFVWSFVVWLVASTLLIYRSNFLRCAFNEFFDSSPIARWFSLKKGVVWFGWKRKKRASYLGAGSRCIIIIKVFISHKRTIHIQLVLQLLWIPNNLIIES